MRQYLLYCATALSLCASTHLCADIVLDDVMSKEDQKNTGVSTLNRQQKIALEEWLNRNFISKVEDKKPSVPEISLSININNGQKLILSDNSVWEIDPKDVDIASVWITPFPVKISPSHDTDYPVLLTNTSTGVSVKARKSVEVPEKPVVPPAVPPATPTPQAQ